MLTSNPNPNPGAPTPAPAPPHRSSDSAQTHAPIEPLSKPNALPPDVESTLLTLTDDLLGNILSRLPYQSIESAACCCHRLLSIVRDDERTWLQACVLQWGVRTDVRRWAGGQVAYRALYHVLRQCDKLAGFWRAVSDSGFKYGSSLVVFEWLPTHLEALRIVPTCQDSYQVRKIPFLRVGVSPSGELLCRESGDRESANGPGVTGLDAKRPSGGGLDSNRPGAIGGNAPSVNAPQATAPQATAPNANGGGVNVHSGKDLEATPTSAEGVSRSGPRENGSDLNAGDERTPSEVDGEPARMSSRLSESSLSDLDDVGPSGSSPMRTPSPGGHRAPSPGPRTARESSLQLTFAAPDHIVLEERLPTRQTWSVEAEAAAGASLGIGHSWRRHSSSPTGARTPPLPACGSSPPGTFNYEIYQFLSSRVASPGGLRQRARRKERERSERQGRVPAQAEHFVRIPEPTPTPERPLQGLWKGIGPLRGLDFVHLSYGPQGTVTCRQLCDANMADVGHFSSSVQWRAVPLDFTQAEQLDYENRGHIGPMLNAESLSDSMRFMISNNAVVQPEVDKVYAFVGSDHRELQGLAQRGRLWQYAPGNFGWGALSGGENWIVDYKRLVMGRTVLESSVEAR